MLEEGIEWKEEKIVEENDTALKMKSGVLPVFSTPSLISFMELTCWKSVELELENGQTTVGVHINADHLKAIQVGKKLQSRSVLKNIDKKRLTFYVEVFEEEKLIGKAVHIRFIVERDKFMSSLT